MSDITSSSGATPTPGMRVVNLPEDEPEASRTGRSKTTPTVRLRPYDPDEAREGTRGDLARGLLWLLTLTIGGMIAFVGLGRMDGGTLAQSVFPSLVTLAGTALGFYFGSQTAKNAGGGDGAQPGK